MRAKHLSCLPWTLMGCLPLAPPLDEDVELDASDTVADSTWPEIDPPRPLDTSSDDGNEADSESLSPDLGPAAAPADAHLRILGVGFDPEGTDGSSGAPEWIELLSLGPDPYPLAELTLEARSWPLVDAGDFPDLDPRALLEPGSRLRIERFASARDLPSTLPSENPVHLAFTSSGGLRNSDGAARVYAPDGKADDEVCYGDDPSPAPFGDPGMWNGSCVATSLGATCRLDPGQDSDLEADWGPCESP